MPSFRFLEYFLNSGGSWAPDTGSTITGVVFRRLVSVARRDTSSSVLYALTARLAAPACLTAAFLTCGPLASAGVARLKRRSSAAPVRLRPQTAFRLAAGGE